MQGSSTQHHYQHLHPFVDIVNLLSSWSFKDTVTCCHHGPLWMPQTLLASVRQGHELPSSPLVCSSYQPSITLILFFIAICSLSDAANLMSLHVICCLCHPFLHWHAQSSLPCISSATTFCTRIFNSTSLSMSSSLC